MEAAHVCDGYLSLLVLFLPHLAATDAFCPQISERDFIGKWFQI